jgi:predicted PurR-regulated permease PerM
MPAVTDVESAAPPPARFGRPGTPLNRSGPFYLGFVGGIGVLLAYHLLGLLTRVSQVLTLVGVAAFLAIGLDPVVRWLVGRGLRRSRAVAIVFVGVLAVFGIFAGAALPALVTQGGELARQLPDQVDSLTRSQIFRRLDEDYGVVTKASEQLRNRLSNGDTVLQVFGGLLGAGRAVISGFVSTITVLVLTLYFMASLHTISEAGYRLVPSSRRERVRLLGDEIVKRIGGYVAGQVAVAAINGALTYLIALLVGLPYPLVLAMAVALLGVIPLVGATLGAIIVVLVGMFDSWQVGLGLLIYYLVYQQVENYVIAPRIMARTVAVPGAVALIAALAGAALLGILGALIAIPVAAGILLLIQEVVIPRQEAS